MNKIKMAEEALREISNASTDEGGCFHTNRRNVRLAQEALAALEAEKPAEEAVYNEIMNTIDDFVKHGERIELSGNRSDVAYINKGKFTRWLKENFVIRAKPAIEAEKPAEEKYQTLSWIKTVCPGCKYQKTPLHIKAPCETCEVGSEKITQAPDTTK